MGTLLPIGTVVNITRRGFLLARAKKPVRIGTPVTDGRRNRVGVVTDVIGPVRAPFVVIRAGSADASMLGKELFAR